MTVEVGFKWGLLEGPSFTFSEVSCMILVVGLVCLDVYTYIAYSFLFVGKLLLLH